MSASTVPDTWPEKLASQNKPLILTRSCWKAGDFPKGFCNIPLRQAFIFQYFHLKYLYFSSPTPDFQGSLQQKFNTIYYGDVL